MHMQSIREIARNFGIKTSRITKKSLIKEIQRAEGNFDCFSTAISGQCDQEGCLWREDCLQSAAKKLHQN